MDGEKQRTIASKGGKAAHAKGTAHEWSSEEARAAGRKGGESRGNRGRGNAPSFAAPNFLSEAGSSLRSPGEYPTAHSYANANPLTTPNPIGDFKNSITTRGAPNYRTETRPS